MTKKKRKPKPLKNLSEGDYECVRKQLTRVSFWVSSNIHLSDTFKYSSECVNQSIYRTIMQLAMKPKNSDELALIATMREEIRMRRYYVQKYEPRDQMMFCLPLICPNQSQFAFFLPSTIRHLPPPPSTAVQPPSLSDAIVDPNSGTTHPLSFELPQLLPQAVNSTAPYDHPRNLTFEETINILKTFQICYRVIARFGHIHPPPLVLITERHVFPILKTVIQLGCQRKNWAEKIHIEFLLWRVYMLRKNVIDHVVYGIKPTTLPLCWL